MRRIFVENVARARLWCASGFRRGDGKDLPPTERLCHIPAVSTLAEIESAVDALPLPQQKELFQNLAERLNDRTGPKRRLPLVPATGSPITQTEIDDALDSGRWGAPANEAVKRAVQDAAERAAKASTSEALEVFRQLQAVMGLTSEGAAAWKEAVAEARGRNAPNE